MSVVPMCQGWGETHACACGAGMSATPCEWHVCVCQGLCMSVEAGASMQMWGCKIVDIQVCVNEPLSVLGMHPCAHLPGYRGRSVCTVPMDLCMLEHSRVFLR